MNRSAVNFISPINFANGIELEKIFKNNLLSKLEEINILDINNDLKEEFLNISKLIKIIAYMEYGLKKLHSITQYEKKLDAFVVKCKNDIYGSLEDLLN